MRIGSTFTWQEAKAALADPWISIAKKGQPKDSGDYLVTLLTEDKELFVGKGMYWGLGNEWSTECETVWGEVLAYQPLPEPYRGK